MLGIPAGNFFSLLWLTSRDNSFFGPVKAPAMASEVSSLNWRLMEVRFSLSDRSPPGNLDNILCISFSSSRDFDGGMTGSVRLLKLKNSFSRTVSLSIVPFSILPLVSWLLSSISQRRVSVTLSKTPALIASILLFWR